MFLGPSREFGEDRAYCGAKLGEFVADAQRSDDEIQLTIADFELAARNAIEAGLGGVELHGATGYLIRQFLSTETNRRDNRWDGTIEGRLRFPVQVANAVAKSLGAHRLGFRISPGIAFNDINDDPDLGAIPEFRSSIILR